MKSKIENLGHKLYVSQVLHVKETPLHALAYLAIFWSTLQVQLTCNRCETYTLCQ
jgi:hypothetical protein